MLERLLVLIFGVDSLDELRLRYVQVLSFTGIILGIIGITLITINYSDTLALALLPLAFGALNVVWFVLTLRQNWRAASYGLFATFLLGLFAPAAFVYPLLAVVALMSAALLLPYQLFIIANALIVGVLVRQLIIIGTDSPDFGATITMIVTLVFISAITRYLIRIGEIALQAARRSVDALQIATNIGQEIATILDIDQLIRAAARTTRLRFNLDQVRITINTETNTYSVQLGDSAANVPIQNFPLQIAGERAGVLSVAAGRALTSAEVQALEIVARLVSVSAQNALSFSTQAAIARQNEALFADAQRSLREIERLNQELTRAAWNEYLADASAIAGVLAQGDQLVPLMDELTVAEDGTISVPVTLRGEVIGTIEVEPGEGRTLDAVEMTQAVAQRLAVSLEAARLYEETRTTAAREQQINAIAARYQSVSTVDELLRITVEELSALLGAQHGAIRLARLESEGASNGHYTGDGGSAR